MQPKNKSNPYIHCILIHFDHSIQDWKILVALLRCSNLNKFFRDGCIYSLHTNATKNPPSLHFNKPTKHTIFTLVSFEMVVNVFGETTWQKCNFQKEWSQIQEVYTFLYLPHAKIPYPNFSPSSSWVNIKMEPVQDRHYPKAVTVRKGNHWLLRVSRHLTESKGILISFEMLSIAQIGWELVSIDVW